MSEENGKEKGIIEKLGITPGPWKLSQFKRDSYISGPTGKYSNVICQPPRYLENGYYPWDVNKQLIVAAPELLEALIDSVIYYDFDNPDMCKKICIIQKATGKSWEEIKALL